MKIVSIFRKIFFIQIIAITRSTMTLNPSRKSQFLESKLTSGGGPFPLTPTQAAARAAMENADFYGTW